MRVRAFMGASLFTLALATPLATPVAHSQVQGTAPAPSSALDNALATVPQGARLGLVVSDASGKVITAIRPDERFIPASNTKIITTATAYFAIPGELVGDDQKGGAGVHLVDQHLYLTGFGDARLSSADDCVTNCLSQLADAVAAGIQRVDDIVIDATAFRDERWSSGMSWNNIPSRSGTAISAVTLDDNELRFTVTPDAKGSKVAINGNGYFAVENWVSLSNTQKTSLTYDRLPMSRVVRISGTIAADAAPQTLRMGIDDPAHYAGWRLAEMLRARGVKVKGTVKTLYAPALNGVSHDVDARTADPKWIAKLSPPSLARDVVQINKESQNLHAELLLRRIGLAHGDGSVAGGLRQMDAMFAAAGVQRSGYEFADGSGMSTYNRITPRAMVTLLNWINRQSWGAEFRQSLPIGGVDGTLSRRFKGTALEGRIFAKTGSINATSALAGYFQAKSGKWLTFASYANDVPAGSSGTAAMDAALIAIAEAN